MKNRAPLLAALALAVCAGCATGSIKSPEGWSVYSTKHFRMYAPNAYRVEETMRPLELHYSALASSFFKGVSEEPIDVVMIEDVDFHDLFGQRRAGAALASTPGGADIGKSGLIVVQPIGAEGESKGGLMSTDMKATTPTTAAEMVAHVLIHRVFPKAPLWFHEGFATWARNGILLADEDQLVGCFGRPDYKKVTYVPLPKLFTMSWEAYSTGDEGREWYKHSAKTFIDYLFYGADGKRRSSLTPLVAAITDGKSNDDIIKAALPDVPLDKLNAEVQEHVRVLETAAASKSDARGRCPLRFPIMKVRQADQEPPRSSPADAAKVQALIAGLQKLPVATDAYAPWYPPQIIEASMSKSGH